ncbi:uncharacterized protein LOC113518173 [Galleria mellonella]|uniref:Uncharacterized protein LOC113518173 n=1 Tax=Galleria mellonella TaxID=7137 RepID=A0A6J1WSV4_GALME|nr:uncharacterized protein LOC113518173 [Galleria mellonella]
MKAGLFILLFVFCYVQSRKTYPPVDKNANIAFINMEGGGGVRPAAKPQPAAPPSGPAAPPAKTPVQTLPAQPGGTNTPVQTTVKPAVPSATTKPPSPAPAPSKSTGQITPVPVNPTPASKPISTPGPGTVKQLVNFYDSQGKASPIRPYSYSQAVKQG